MHREMAQAADAMRLARSVRRAIIAPRGNAKSTLWSFAYPLRSALEGDEPYVWIISDAADQARQHLENINEEWETNGLLRELYPHVRVTARRKQRLIFSTGSTVEALGTGQRVRGKRRGANRPSLIVCDDLENDKHVASAGQRTAIWDWFTSAVLKAGNPRTNVVLLGSALHRESLLLRACGNPSWQPARYRAIEAWPRRMDLWADWERIYCQVDRADHQQEARDFYDQHRDEMDEGARVLWPEYQDLYSLMRMRIDDGRTAFEREMQGEPVNPELCEWPEEYFAHDTFWFDEWPASWHVRTLALDPSKGKDAKHGDYSALVWVLYGTDGYIYVDADLKRRPTPEMVTDGVERYRAFEPDVFGIEANAWQDLLQGDFLLEFRQAGVQQPRLTGIDNRVKKAVRIRRLAPLLSGRRLRFKSNSPGTRLLVEQLRDFPIGDHDDGPDSLEMACRLADSFLAESAEEQVEYL